MDHSVVLDAPGRHHFGDPSQPVTQVAVMLISGRVDVIAHDDPTTAVCEIHDVEGAPVTATWAAGNLRLDGIKDDRGQLLGAMRDLVMGSGRRAACVTLSVPARTRVTVNTVGADALVGDVSGDVSINTVSGGVRLSGLSGRVDVKTVNGQIDAHALAGDLRATTISGDITLDAGRPRSVKVSTSSGTTALDLRCSSCLVTVASMSGDATVRLPLGSGYDATASSRSGHVVVDGSTLSGGAAGERGGHRSDGDRGVALKLRSVSGNVVVLRETVADVQDVRPSQRESHLPLDPLEPGIDGVREGDR